MSSPQLSIEQAYALVGQSRYNQLDEYRPYDKQREFHTMGAEKLERCLFGGNKIGKTHCGGMEGAFHLTGLYPEDWEGWRFDKPILMWAAGVTNETTRDTVQKVLMGDDPYGTGAIPKDCIHKAVLGRGIPSLLDHVYVKHVSGGHSKLQFKAYEQGQKKWWGPNVDLVWFDEEPPQEIYDEGVWRTAQVKGRTYMTFTPLMGRTPVVSRFFPEPDSVSRGAVRMQLEDADHFANDPEQMEALIERTPEHERDARTKGLPMLGQGRVFGAQEDSLRVQAFDIPNHWPRIAGMDFGWDHPTAVAWIAWDRGADCIYVTDEHSVSREVPAIHAAAVRARGDWIPIAWPHDGYQNDKQAGIPIAEAYRKQHRLRMLAEHATHDGGGQHALSVEAGVLEMTERMKTGRLKVFAHCEKWFEEFQNYHRKDGKIVKEMDDLMSATRYGITMRRFARTPESLNTNIVRNESIDYDPFSRPEYRS